ncbi:MAG: hypothetical protein LPK12_10795, partial [Rhodobacterales bacterium]|nr:hypothetical protein [Rhodobacterales bacterium]MDX5500437.1 hypothetical protein [Rhodobacterales bacterium]
GIKHLVAAQPLADLDDHAALDLHVGLIGKVRRDNRSALDHSAGNPTLPISVFRLVEISHGGPGV